MQYLMRFWDLRNDPRLYEIPVAQDYARVFLFVWFFKKGEKPFCVWFFKIAPPLQCKTPWGIHDLVPGAYCFIMKNDQMTKWPPSSISWDPEIWDMACRNEKLHSKNSGLPPVLHWKRAHWLVFRAFRTSIVRTNPSWRMNTKTLDTRHGSKHCKIRIWIECSKQKRIFQKTLRH